MSNKTKAQLEQELANEKAQRNSNLNPFDAVRNVFDTAVITTRMVKNAVIRAETVVDIVSNGVEASATWFETKVRNEIVALGNPTEL